MVNGDDRLTINSFHTPSSILMSSDVWQKSKLTPIYLFWFVFKFDHFVSSLSSSNHCRLWLEIFSGSWSCAHYVYKEWVSAVLSPVQGSQYVCMFALWETDESLDFYWICPERELNISLVVVTLFSSLWDLMTEINTFLIKPCLACSSTIGKPAGVFGLRPSLTNLCKLWMNGASHPHQIIQDSTTKDTGIFRIKQ